MPPMKPPKKSARARFDIGHLEPRALDYKEAGRREVRRERPMLSCDLNIESRVSSQKWLSIYGLKANALRMADILPASGFKHSDGFDHTLGKDICSKYGEGLFTKFPDTNGRVYNVIAQEKLFQYEQQLKAAISMYNKGLNWMTDESRRFFGVIQENVIVIVIDVCCVDDVRFDLYISALQQVLCDQVKNVTKFNLIRAAQDIRQWRESVVPVANDTLNDAKQWLAQQDNCCNVTPTCVVEAVSRALADRSCEAVYLFSENGASTGSRELLREKAAGFLKPVNTVAYNITDTESLQFLRSLASTTGGRFYAFAISETEKNVLTGGVSHYGGTPGGVGVPEEVMLIWHELEHARSTLEYVRDCIQASPEPKKGGCIVSTHHKKHVTTDGPNEMYMTSKDWLRTHGLKANGLFFYTFLGSVAFRHCDGVINVKNQPKNGLKNFNLPAISQNVLVNAKYCDKFVHVHWKDSSVRHVQVTGRMFREYEERMNRCLKQIKNRIAWLCQGSRELFGTICEDKVYILIDTSASMATRIQVVKEKMYQLMQEQLKHKVRFNIIAFGSVVLPWRQNLMPVTEENLKDAYNWLTKLEPDGSTNTLDALKIALNDHETQAIYLLSDGRPDQLPRTILTQVCLHPKIPIHTISFNCYDKEANDFLYQLATSSGGRFHFYEDRMLFPDGPSPYVSEDLQLLRQEHEEGTQNLRLVAKLRAECAALEWKIQGIRSQSPSRSESRTSTISLARFRDTPKKKDLDQPRQLEKHDLDRTNLMQNTLYTLEKYESDPNIDKSLDVGNKWTLPETKEMFDQQEMRKEDAIKTAISTLERVKLMTQPKEIVTPRTRSITTTAQQWLAKNGLVAKRLTIIDALSSTVITRSPKYIPSINRTVQSKVFEEIFPFSYASFNLGEELGLVNPSGVDLKKYEEKLVSAIKSFYRQIENQIWECLPGTEKQKFDYQQPSFETDRDAIFEALRNCNWPIPESDIKAYVDEIEIGEKFLRQSVDLRMCLNFDKETFRKKIDRSLPSLSRQIKSARINSSSPRTKLARNKPTRVQKPPSTRATGETRVRSSNHSRTQMSLDPNEMRLIQIYRQNLNENKERLESQYSPPHSDRNDGKPKSLTKDSLSSTPPSTSTQSSLPDAKDLNHTQISVTLSQKQHQSTNQ